MLEYVNLVGIVIAYTFAVAGGYLLGKYGSPRRRRLPDRDQPGLDRPSVPSPGSNSYR